MPKGFKGFQKGNQLGKMNKGNSRCAWNKGLTKEIDERVMKSSKKCSETEKIQYQIYGRKPSFGFLGKKHSIKWKKEQSKRFSGNKNPSKREEVKIKIREARKKQICPVKDTSIEIKIQNFLKQLNMEFYTHQYINIKHGYQYDILIPSMNLIIECDGNYWHKYPFGNDIDKIRTSELIEKGFKVLRLWESEIKEMDLNKFKNKLKGGESYA